MAWLNEAGGWIQFCLLHDWIPSKKLNGKIGLDHDIHKYCPHCKKGEPVFKTIKKEK